ncbi:MAG: DNA repair protein RadA, partial [Tepidiphilus sp.]|nr:DNA repair protein RadA [Tepidiphilus sp.]
MAKARTVFVCRECGARFPRWQGQCSQCQAWNTLDETHEAADGSGPTLHRA